MNERIKEMSNRYFITAFSGMAQGLFVTLIAGTIVKTAVLQLEKLDFFAGSVADTALMEIAILAQLLMGAGIGVGIAYALGHSKLLVFVAAPVGLIGAEAGSFFGPEISGTFEFEGSLLTALSFPGNPIGAYIVTLIVVEIVGLYAGKTSLDIVLTPLGALLLAAPAVYISYPVIWFVNKLSFWLADATNAAPLIMGIIVAVSVGLLLTMPTSSAAAWVAVSMPVLGAGAAASQEQIDAMLLAGGAAAVGCAAQMVGFAVSSYRENKWGGVIAQGLGTSMLQIPNILRKPIIIVPMTISSAILGALSTTIFKINVGPGGGGMGTSGLVGVIDAFEHTSGTLGQVGIILLMIVLPAILSLAMSEWMRKMGWIKFGDMKLPE